MTCFPAEFMSDIPENSRARKREITPVQHRVNSPTQPRPDMVSPLHRDTAHEKGESVNTATDILYHILTETNHSFGTVEHNGGNLLEFIGDKYILKNE